MLVPGRFSAGGADRRVALAGCLLLLAAAWTGAWWDEYSRAGWSSWRSICQSGSPDLPTVLYLYAALLPTSLIAMLLAGLVVVACAALLAARRRAALALAGIAGHAGGIAAMPLAVFLCAKLLDDPPAAADGAGLLSRQRRAVLRVPGVSVVGLRATGARGTPKCAATRRSSSALALPSTGGAVSLGSQVPWSRGTRELSRAFGLTWIRSVRIVTMVSRCAP